MYKKLLYPTHFYLNLSEVEKMDIFIGEFSFYDMQLLSDKLDEINEFNINASSCYELIPKFNIVTFKKSLKGSAKKKRERSF